MDLELPEEPFNEERQASIRRPFFSHPAVRIWTAGITAVFLVFGLQGFYPDAIGPISNIVPSLGATAAMGSALACWRRYGGRVRRGLESIWFLFSLGFGLWLAAEITWAVYYFFLNVEVPYPSAADLFYIGGYIPMAAGLGLYLRAFWGSLTRRRLVLVLVAIGSAVSLALWFVVPIEFSEHLSLLTTATDLAYPVLDLTLFSLTLLALAIFLGGAISRWWILFGAGSLLYVFGDELFLYKVAAGTYYNGGIDDVIFILGYLTFALAFFVHRREL